MRNQSITACRRRVWAWYRRHGRRDLPWRRTRNPYRVLVSEVMLQQTQVGRVLPKYRSFVREFPSLRALARAPLPRVLTVWQGLGYNRRAKHLRNLARVVADENRGRWPCTVEKLVALPGVGPYTARAVACLAFGVPVALVETNIRKVILHEFFPRRRSVAEREVNAVAERLLDRAHPRDWNLALMDYGAAYFGGGRSNPNRRSASYAPQPRFTGSRRFVRGRIVALLTERAALTKASIARELGRAWRVRPVACAAALRSLVDDGLVTRRVRRYCLAS